MFTWLHKQKRIKSQGWGLIKEHELCKYLKKNMPKTKKKNKAVSTIDKHLYV